MAEPGSPAEELVEQLDDAGKIIRVVPRGQMRSENLLHRNIVVVVRRTSGAIVVHKRADWKDINPSMWDLAFGGVPNVGESDLDAAVRELAEEAGLKVDPADLTDLGAAEWTGESLRWIGRIYEIVDDREIEAVDGEVVAIDEVQPLDLADWFADVAVCPDSGGVLGPLLVP